MSPRKNASTALSTVPATVEVVDSSTPSAENHFVLLQATPQVRANAEKAVATQFGEVILSRVRAERAHEKMAEVYLKLRRMFPASDEVRAVLGSDAIDLIGATDAYREAVTRMNETSRDLLINAARREGFTVKGATQLAADDLEKFRKSVSRSYRIQVDTWARKELGAIEGAKFLLAHGFKPNKEVGKSGLLITGMSLTEDGQLALPAGKKVSDNGKDIVDVVESLEAAEQSDQAAPGETADAAVKALESMLGHPLTNPQELINTAVGLLNDAAALLPKAKMTLKERNACRAALLSAVKKVVGELEDGQVETVDVVAAVK